MTKAGSSSSGWALTSNSGRSSLPVFLALLTFSCAGFLGNTRPIPPQQAGADAWERLSRLHSFDFALSFHTDTPFPIEVKFSGTHEQPDRESWSGSMRRRPETSRVEFRAEGPDQYDKEQSVWRRTMRGIETRVLEQGEAALGNKSFQFAGSEHGRYRFTFRPDLPILDPTQTRKLTGVMEVDPRSGLPLRLYCSDPTRMAEWDLRLGRFNRAGTVSIPYEPAMTVDARPVRRMSRTAFGRAIATINQRLEKLGWDCRMHRTSDGLTLQLGQPKSRRQVELLFSRGKVEVWQGRWSSKAEDTTAAIEVGRDASRRVVLDRLLGGNERISVDVRVSSPVDAELMSVVPVSDTSEPAILLVNNVALAAGTLHQDGRVAFDDIGGEDDVRVISALAACDTIPADFSITVRP